MKPDSVYLAHILECIRKVREDVAAGREAFFKSHLIQDAVLRNLQVMAESTQRLSAECKHRRPDIDWRRIGEFRNVLVHDYLGVDLEIVWRVISDDMGTLEEAVHQLSETPPPTGSLPRLPIP